MFIIIYLILSNSEVLLFWDNFGLRPWLFSLSEWLCCMILITILRLYLSIKASSDYWVFMSRFTYLPTYIAAYPFYVGKFLEFADKLGLIHFTSIKKILFSFRKFDNGSFKKLDPLYGPDVWFFNSIWRINVVYSVGNLYNAIAIVTVLLHFWQM